MALSLVTPLVTNFLKEFPGQNEVNCNRIDDYAGPCLTSHPLQSYSPVLTAAATDPVLGTGAVNRAFYYRIFNQVYVWGELRWGSSGASFGSGPYILTLPFPAAGILVPSTVIGSSPCIGNGMIWDDSTAAGRQACSVHLRTANQIWFGNKMVSGVGSREAGIGGPISWAVNDGIFWSARYQKVP